MLILILMMLMMMLLGTDALAVQENTELEHSSREAWAAVTGVGSHGDDGRTKGREDITSSGFTQGCDTKAKPP
jgi:hypothetical protein